MFRRSRFSARPNVGTVGRGATATPQEVPPAKQEANETSIDTSDNNTASSAVVDNKSEVTSENAAVPEDGNDHNGDGTSSAAAVQRRKRFSVKPKVAPGRLAALSRTPKSPIKAISEPSSSGVGTSPQTVSTRSGNTASTQGLQSPRRRRSSEGNKSPRVQPKPALVSSDTSEPEVVPPAEDLTEQTPLLSASSSQSESTSDSQVKEVPPIRLPDKVPPSLPDREANEISEKARTLVSSKTALSLTASAYSLTRLLNGPSDLQRLVKAQKLRELLKQERWKEKTLKRAKARSKEYSLDPTKMTMRDLIHYLPTSNPMSYDLEDSMQENETVLPPSPVREGSPEPAQEPEAPPNNTTNAGEEEEEGEDDQEDALMVPQVKVAEDGSLIIDEESLTVEVQRAKGPNPVQDRDPIFERGSTTTYSSFRKGTYTKPWSSEETDMFFLAVSMVGTDFSMICQLFPHRARSEIKNKFKKEERLNAWRIDKAFKERRKLDIEYFSKLLEKILEVQKNRKKLKSLAEKNAPKPRKRKAPAKKPSRRLSNVEEVDEEDEDEVPDLEEEGEKENEELCNEGHVPDPEPTKKSKKKKRTDPSAEEPHDKKSKAENKSSDQGEAGVPEDAEAALPEDHTNSDTPQDVAADKNQVIKPAKLSRARAPKPTLALGRKWGKKAAPSPKPNDTATDKEDENGEDAADEEQVNKDASTSSEATQEKAADGDISDDEEETLIKPPRPTRYGRVPKPTKPLFYSDKDDTQSSASEPSLSTTPAAQPKPKCTAKRRRPPKQQPSIKKPKLVTLKASQSEFSDEDNEGHWDNQEVEGQHQSSSSRADNDGAFAFVPTGLHTLQPEISEVDESMEELDILASMPDVLGISQEALCPDSSCEHAQHETDTAEPYEHQLDLLVDVIDFLSTENTEVSEEQSYNEAAQTLLTIGNVAHITQSAHNEDTVEDHGEGTSEDNNKASNLEEQIASRSAIEEESAYVSSHCDQDVTTSDIATTVEVTTAETHTGSAVTAQMSASDQESTEQIIIELEPEPQYSSKNPQANKGRFSKEKPKANLTRMPKTAAQEILPETGACDPTMSKVNLIDETSIQEMIDDQVETTAAMSDQASSEIQSHLSTESQFEPCSLATWDANVSSESTDEKPASSIEISETSLNDPATCVSKLSELDQVTVIHLTTDQGKSRHDVPHGEDSPVYTEENAVETTHQSRRSRLQKIKPNVTQASRTIRTKVKSSEGPVGTESPSECIKESLASSSEASGTVPETAVLQEAGLHPAQKQDHESSVVVATHTEEVTPTQEECTVSASRMKRGRFQKPNVPQTAGTEKAKTQTRKDLNRSPELEVEPQPTCILTTEKWSQSTDPTSSVNPPFAVDGNLKGLSPNQDKHTHPEPRSQEDVIPSSPEKETTESKNLCESQFDAPIEQNIRDPGSTTEVNDEFLLAQVQPADLICKSMITNDSSITESQVGQETNVPSASVQFQTGQDDDDDGPAFAGTRVNESPAHNKESQAASTPQQRRGRLQKIKPKPVLAQISRTRRSKCQTPNEPVERETSLRASLEVGPCPHSPERSQSTCPALSVVSVVEQAPTDSHPTSSMTEQSLVPQVDAVTSGPAHQDSQMRQDSNAHSAPVEVHETSDDPTVAGGVQQLPASQKDTASVSSRSPVKKSRLQKIKPKPNLSQTRTVKPKPGLKLGEENDLPPAHGSSNEGATLLKLDQEDYKLDTSSGAAGPTARQITDSTADSSQHGSSESLAVSTDACSVHLEGKSPVESPDGVKSELTDSSQTTSKAPHAQRGRLIKPKPALSCRSRRPQPQEAKDTNLTESDCCSDSLALDGSGDHKVVLELRPDDEEPASRATQDIEPSHESLARSAQPPQFGAEVCGKVVPQNTEGMHDLMLQDMLPDNVPLDPDKTFFVLSLTEIPVPSFEEAACGAAEPPSLHTVTGASIQQPSVSGESFVTAGESSSFDIDTVDKGLSDVEHKGTDGAASNDPESSQGSGSVSVEPQAFCLTTESDEAAMTPAKQKPTGTGRRAKSQIKPVVTKTRQSRKSKEAKQSESAPSGADRDSEHARNSLQPTALNRDITEVPKESRRDVHGESHQEADVSWSAETTQSVQTRRRTRGKAKAAPTVNPPPGKAASTGSQAEAPPTRRKQPSPEPVASTSHDAVSARQPKEIRVPTVPSPAEAGGVQASHTVSESQQSEILMSSSQEEEEALSVSQYFFSDIFTEVEEE